MCNKNSVQSDYKYTCRPKQIDYTLQSIWYKNKHWKIGLETKKYQPTNQLSLPPQTKMVHSKSSSSQCTHTLLNTVFHLLNLRKTFGKVNLHIPDEELDKSCHQWRTLNSLQAIISSRTVSLANTFGIKIFPIDHILYLGAFYQDQACIIVKQSYYRYSTRGLQEAIRCNGEVPCYTKKNMSFLQDIEPITPKAEPSSTRQYREEKVSV